MPDYNYIHQEMKRKKKTKVTLSFLWEEYKSTYGEQAYAYTQFRVYYRRYKQRLNPSMRQIHIAGEKVFVEFMLEMILQTIIKVGNEVGNTYG